MTINRVILSQYDHCRLFLFCDFQFGGWFFFSIHSLEGRKRTPTSQHLSKRLNCYIIQLTLFAAITPLSTWNDVGSLFYPLLTFPIREKIKINVAAASDGEAQEDHKPHILSRSPRSTLRAKFRDNKILYRFSRSRESRRPFARETLQQPP